MTGRSVDGARVVAGRYQLQEQLGSGGMGTVWRGDDVVLGRSVAVKEVTFPSSAPAAEQQVLRERIRREARAAAQLDHPGAVTVYDVVEEGSATYLVMQHVPAPTLAEVLHREGPLPPEHVAQVGLAVLETLGAAHARGIVHRDVKPSNVLLHHHDEAPPGRALLTDFGIASAPGDSRLTSTGLLIGSPAYMAPERVRREESGPASDLWSLGATLFTAVEGRAPYDGADPMATLAALLVGGAAPYVRAGPLRPVLERLLERDPAARMTAAEAREALRALATSAGSWVAAGPWSPPQGGAGGTQAASETVVLPLGGHGAGPALPPPPAPGDAQGAGTSPPAVVIGGGAPRPRGRWRTPRLVAAVLSIAAVVAVAAVALRATGADRPGRAAAPPTSTTPATAPSTTSPAATTATAGPAPRPTSGSILAPLPATALTPGDRLRATITSLAELARRGPGRGGPGVPAVLERLRAVEAAAGNQRRSAALAASTSTSAAVARGDVDAEVGTRVQEVLTAVARPDRLIDLVETVEADPSAIGPGGQALRRPLYELDHEVPADETAAKAAALLRQVDDGARSGALTPAFQAAATPKLQELADPAPHQALRSLLAEVERDPGRVGRAGPEVLTALRAIATLPVFPQGNEAKRVLALVERRGAVTPTFREVAVRVLSPLVR